MKIFISKKTTYIAEKKTVAVENKNNASIVEHLNNFTNGVDTALTTNLKKLKNSYTMSQAYQVWRNKTKFTTPNIPLHIGMLLGAEQGTNIQSQLDPIVKNGYILADSVVAYLTALQQEINATWTAANMPAHVKVLKQDLTTILDAENIETRKNLLSRGINDAVIYFHQRAKTRYIIIMKLQTRKMQTTAMLRF